MQKHFIISLVAIFMFFFADAQKKRHRLFDQDLIITQCNIDISIKGIIATTWVELEFYNNKSKEEEGRYNFALNPGQAITDFKLMLGDKYRDGSIEERWKARAAYGSIVGKRMDPALLQLIRNNYYSLNIYPFSAKGTRKVKFKIEEVLAHDSTGYHYNLDFLKKDSIGKLNITATVKGYVQSPIIDSGLLSGFNANANNNGYNLKEIYNEISEPAPIEFTIPEVPNENYKTGYIQPDSGNFFVKLKTDIPDTFNIDIKKLRVYWDCSASMEDSDKLNFMNYLQLVITKYKPSQLTIIPFNQQLISEKIFSQQQINNNGWQSFIEAVPLYGATQFGILNLSTDDDLILVFTDGKQTWGRKHPASIQTPVTFITTNYNFNYYNDSYNYYTYYKSTYNEDIIKNYRLYNNYYNDNATVRINSLATFKTKLLTAKDEYGNPINISNNQQVYSNTVLAGKLKTGSAKLILEYGISNKVLCKQEINFQTAVNVSDFNRAEALIQFEEIMKNNYWYNTLSFGIDNKILTSQTAFIVLEKVDDYVKYNITPPDDLLKECVDKGFVKHNYKETYKHIQQLDALETLKLVAGEYNKRIVLWGDSSNKIDLNIIAADYLDIQENNKKEIRENGSSRSGGNAATNPSYKTNSKSLDEVVVVGYGSQHVKDVTGSISITRSSQISDLPTMDVGEMIQGRIAGVEVIQSSGQPGASSQITIRGVSSLNSTQPLFVIDGIAQPSGKGAFSPGNNISPYDIESITVLKDASACAIYGANAAGGVILIKTKSGRYYGYNNYSQHITLKNLEDIDYMQEIKNAAKENKYEKYLSLKSQYKTNMGFYTDIALYFYEQGLTQYIDEILMNAAETSNSDFESQLTIAFIYEYMKEYDKAITIYQNLKEDYPNSLQLSRNLGWAYYQNNQLDSAVSTLYKEITTAAYSTYDPDIQLKDIMLADMNMIIALHPTEVHIGYIPKEIIKPIAADMRVLVESPTANIYGLSIKQPWKEEITNQNPINPKGQRLQIGSSSTAEFTIKNANNKKYAFTIPAYNNNGQYYVPSLIRVIKIKDFGKSTQSIDTDIVNIDNQYGNVEFEAFKISK